MLISLNLSSMPHVTWGYLLLASNRFSELLTMTLK